MRARARTNNHEAPAAPSFCVPPLTDSLWLALSPFLTHPRSSVLATAAADHASSLRVQAARDRARARDEQGSGGRWSSTRLWSRSAGAPTAPPTSSSTRPSARGDSSLFFSFPPPPRRLLPSCSAFSTCAPVTDSSLSAIACAPPPPPQVRHEEDPPLQAERQVPADRVPGGNIISIHPKPFSDPFTRPHSSTKQSRSRCLAGLVHAGMRPASAYALSRPPRCRRQQLLQ